MKKQIVLALGLAVLATPAFATKARLQALGESANGSFYVNDNRNIFLNAAEINNNKDLVTFEWGDTTNGQGGLNKAVNNLVYGLHLNNGSNFDSTEAIDAGAANVTGLNPSSIDLFVGGDMGVKWGANLTYVNGTDENATVGDDGAGAPVDLTSDAETKAMDLNVGVEAGDIKGFVNFGINGEATYKDVAGGAFAGADKVTVDRDQDLTVGGSYQLNAYTLFGQFGMSEYTAKVDGAKSTQEDNSFQVGAGRQDKLNDKVTLFTKASYVNSKSESKDAAGDKKTEKSWNVPVVIGLEAEATSWLAVRGSVSQAIISKNEDKDDAASTKFKSTDNNSTVVAVGASLHFGEFSVDGLVSGEDTGKLKLDDVLSTVSMSYRF